MKSVEKSTKSWKLNIFISMICNFQMYLVMLNFWTIFIYIISEISSLLLSSKKAQKNLPSFVNKYYSLNRSKKFQLKLNLYSNFSSKKAEYSSRLNIYGPPTPRKLTKAKFTDGSKWKLHCPMGGWPLNVETIEWEKDGSILASGGLWSF